MDWPWAYDSTSGDWQWFSADGSQWIYAYPPGDGWSLLKSSSLAQGWSYWDGDGVWAYDADTGAWCWRNTADTQSVVNMRTGMWSRFGEDPVPTGMVPIPGGTNAGTNALGVGESYSVRYPQTYSLTVNMGYDGYDTRYKIDPYPYTSPVGSFPPPNGYGLYDMAGNVREWCFEWFPGYWGEQRTFCGGNWGDGAYRMRVTTRGYGSPGSADYDGLGFRAVLSP